MQRIERQILCSHPKAISNSRRAFLQLMGGMALLMCLPSVFGEWESPGYVYDDFLELLTEDRYNVFPVIEWEIAKRTDKVNVALRHDACFNPYLALKMANKEIKRGIKSSYYLRISDAYNISNQIGAFKGLESLGYEIGYHYDDMDKCDVQRVNSCAIESFKGNLAFLRGYFDIKSVSPHGGKFNYMLDQSDEWLQLSKDVGVISAYHLPYDVYLTDPSLEHLKSVLELQKPGSLVELLAHPDQLSVY